MVFQIALIKESGELRYDSDVALNIPPGTVMAYSVIEMSISSDGHFGQWHLCDDIEYSQINALSNAQLMHFSVLNWSTL